MARLVPYFLALLTIGCAADPVPVPAPRVAGPAPEMCQPEEDTFKNQIMLPPGMFRGGQVNATAESMRGTLGATLYARFHVITGLTSNARLFIGTMEEWRKREAGQTANALYVGQLQSAGEFDFSIREPGTYVVVFDNRQSWLTLRINFRIVLRFLDCT
jgi:hypothetical protein